MELNIKNFITTIKKSTINHMNDYCQFQFKDNKISWSLINQEQNIISRGNIENNIISGINEDLEINMSTPEINVIPYLQMFQNECVDVKYTKLRAQIASVLKLKDDDITATINLSEPVISRYFSKTANNLNVAFKTEIDASFKSSFDKIKKIAARTNKIYLISENGCFFIESGDRSIKYVNSVRVEIQNAEKASQSFVSQYIYKNVQALFSVLSDDTTYFLELLTNGKAYISYIYSDNKSEEYYIMPQL